MKADSLRCCHHDLERTLHGSGKFSQAWLKKERLLWHPDKFAAKADATVYAADMFKMIQRMFKGLQSQRQALGESVFKLEYKRVSYWQSQSSSQLKLDCPLTLLIVQDSPSRGSA